MLQIVSTLTGFYALLLGLITLILWAYSILPHPIWFVGIGIVVITIIVTAFDFAGELRN